MAQHSAGVLLYRRRAGKIEVLLVHPGGPFWAGKDNGAWSIPKGVCAPGEDALRAARRELQEETGLVASGEFTPLGSFAQASGKIVTAFASEGDFDPRQLTSNSCRVAWPPRSGRMIEVPEVDEARWFPLDTACVKIIKGQVPILRALDRTLARATEPEGARHEL